MDKVILKSLTLLNLLSFSVISGEDLNVIISDQLPADNCTTTLAILEVKKYIFFIIINLIIYFLFVKQSRLLDFILIYTLFVFIKRYKLVWYKLIKYDI